MTAVLRQAGLAVFLVMLVLGSSGTASAGPLNLVSNGDFSGGASGFGSDYSLTPGYGYDPSSFTVTDDPALWHPSFADIGDHTSGNGLMYVGNGSIAQGQTVWQSGPISVASGQQYFFEAFVANVCCTDFNRPNGQSVMNFLLTFNGGPTISLGTRSTDPMRAGMWQGLSTDWQSFGDGTVVLSLQNENSAYDANDFALDDLYFGTETSLSPVPEPASMVLLGTGLLGLARVAQKRRAPQKPAERS
jgi:hypothetical protein